MVLNIDPHLFSPSAIPASTRAFNEKLQEIMSKGPKWYEVGAPKYRKMRANGETPLPAATYLPSATSFSIPSRDSGRSIPCRILKPQSTSTPPKAIFLHIHGGGWVLQDEKSQDPALQAFADNLNIICISVGYRLAPEHPFPAGPEDCYDAAEWLVLHGNEEFEGAELAFVGGESAGAHLSMLVALHLLGHEEERFSRGFGFKGLLLHFGCYDLTFTPGVYNFKRTPILVLSQDLMEHYISAFLPDLSVERKRKPDISPLYTDLEPLRGRLPPALFTCGTEDCLLDDTVFMASKYVMVGDEVEVKIVPGVPHGYIMFPRDAEGSGSKEGNGYVESFVKRKLGV